MIPLDVSILSAFLVFCRIGSCIMMMPGLSGYRLPVRVRLLLAVAVSLAILPLMYDDLVNFIRNANSAQLLLSIGTEMATGAIIGTLARIFYLMLQMMLVAIAQFIGLSSPMGLPEDGEVLPSLATLMILAATTMMFLTDQHYEMLRGLIASYRQIPVGVGFGGRGALIQASDQLSAALMIAMRLASPFLIYSLIINFAVGLINKLVPQIPVYFISAPFILLGGLILLYGLSDQMLTAFSAAFNLFLRTG
ncbi:MULTISPECIES: flagellar biosynthesis protein FliR [Azorhizobium]|uniref:Type III secretion system inner membrane R protein n=1 Tax=Azorhizobium caulinodans (strain ATCC 43989 / DSM 5975 / JCM 20966 / LMG 6465 / NBRC 14845 / NCIMB 13405 / ORS 571) TaxID=438753 RepID=A8IPM9_AZOC5|nr:MULTISPECIES: flagellar biosynthesis protein FliR [Azorhizobium]TDT88873.1 flagellar biosynthetic protein FliR [Azorhizobium sp. AG788]BAF86653.1 type III secretion system inner membrane R protein [Azorhizobium caulinodans ORS 571]